MKKDFSKKWITSKSPNKQRKYVANAPKHLVQKIFHANLSKDLRKESGRRSFRVKKGDVVRIMRGTFKGKNGKVETVMLEKFKVYVAGIEVIKKDGSKTRYPIHVSNLMIEELNLDDKRRKSLFLKQKNKEETKEKVEKKEKTEKKAKPKKSKKKKTATKKKKKKVVSTKKEKK